MENLIQFALLQVITFTIAQDSYTKGMQTAFIFWEEGNTAESPYNPRMVHSKTSQDMGSAQYFGQATSPSCNDLERAIHLFANFKPESPFCLNWRMDKA